MPTKVTRLAVEELAHAFDGNEILKCVSFDVACGEIVALIGPNGAGKSTCFNILSGEIRPNHGRILLDGEDISRLNPHQRWRRGIGRGYQIAATFRSLSVLDNAKAALLQHHRSSWRLFAKASAILNEPAEALLDRVGLLHEKDRPSHMLSYGNLRRLELALAIANRPRLLLLDEPTAGMSANDRREVMGWLRDLALESDVAILLTDHDIDVVFEIASRILVLDKGGLIADGDPAAIRRNKAVREAYLGDLPDVGART
jgi:branched-chain amino acid transport system ATP-binding protein